MKLRFPTSLLLAVVLLAGCATATPRRPYATADELDRAARTGVIPEHWRPVDRQAAEILRGWKLEGGTL